MNLTELAEERFEYIARDLDGELYAFIGKPAKLSKVWLSFYTHRLVNGLELDFIKWEDEEPYNITDLIKEERGRAMKITQEMYDRLQVNAQVKEQQRKRKDTQTKKNKAPDSEDIRREAMWELSHSL